MPEGSDRVTNGELKRVIDRLERSMSDFRTESKSEIRRLGADVQLALNELRETRVRVTASEFDISELHTEAHGIHTDIRKLDEKLNDNAKDMVKNVAFVSGGIAAIAYLAKYLPFLKP